MQQKYFEDFVLGETFDIPSKTLTENEILKIFLLQNVPSDVLAKP